MALTTINSDGVKDDSIVNADIKSDAAIAGTKVAPNFGSQNIVTTGTIGIGASPTTGKLEINAGSSGTDVTVLRLDSDNGGAFNIQCSDASSATPIWKFDLGISEGLEIDSATTTRFLSGSGDSSIAIGKTGAANDAVVLKYDESGDKLHFYGWGGSEGDILTLDNGNSRVGIGTTTVASVLDVRDTSTTSYPFTSADSGVYSYSPYPHELNIKNLTTGTDDGFAGIHFHAGERSAGGRSGTARISALYKGEYKADLVFATRNTSFKERMRITAAGNVSINNDTPETFAALQVKNNTTNNHSSLLLHGADLAQILLRDETGGSNEKVTTIRNDQGDFLVGTHNDAYSNWQENIRIKHAGGITFNGDTSTNNALNDYEEGDWTFSFSAGTVNNAGTTSGRVCRYKKVGGIVHFWFDVFQVNNTMEIDGNVTIDGLPFSAETSFHSHMNISTYNSNGSSTIVKNYMNDAENIEIHDNGTLSNIRHFWGWGSYPVSD